MAERAENEGFRLLDDFVCYATTAPGLAQVESKKQGANEGIRVVDELVFERFDPEPVRTHHTVEQPLSSRPTNGPAGNPVIAAKSRWVQVIKQNMVTSEGERMRITEERGLIGDRLEVRAGTATHDIGVSAHGQEVGILSNEHLAVYHTQEGYEFVQYVPWEVIVCISFGRRHPKV